MRRSIRHALLLVALALAAPAFAADLAVKVQIPALNVAEKHRPYIAIWVERADQSIAADLALWYQTDRKKEDGTQWLKDLRQWWRRGGRERELPIDGVTGATRPVGEHQLTFKGTSKPLAQLVPGKYSLVVDRRAHRLRRSISCGCKIAVFFQVMFRRNFDLR